MPKSIQLRWIAEAEARAVRQAASIEYPAAGRGEGSRAAEEGWLDRFGELALGAGRTMLRLLSGAMTVRPPGRLAAHLGASSAEVDADRVLVTILISDIVESTMWVARVGDRPWRELLDRHDDATRQQIKRFGGSEIRNCGDGFLAIFDSATRAVCCAAAIAKAIAPLDILVRSGIHTGEVYLKGNEISGIAAHVAARIAAIAQPCETVVSGTVRDIVAGSGLMLEDRGLHRLRGVPDEVRLYAMRLPGSGGDAGANDPTVWNREDADIAAGASACYPLGGNLL
jgi:class 3 adenylate cyclase